MRLTRFLVVTGLAAAGLATQAHAIAVYGLTTMNSLVRFDSATPSVIESTVALTTVDGHAIPGQVDAIDFRPATGELFALARIGQTLNGWLYTIDVVTGVATAVGAVSQFVPAGSSFGFDFDPTTDRIRVTSDYGLDLRLDPNTGGIAATDPTLAYAAGDVNAAATPSIVASAYTNSFAGSTTTTLYDIDSTLLILATQNPPNAGILHTVGSLGVNPSSINFGFDIAFLNNQAFASIQFRGAQATGFYRVDLASGAATFVDTVGPTPFFSGITLRDISIAAVTEPATAALFGIGVLGLALHARRRPK